MRRHPEGLSGVSPVVAIILLVAITVVLTGFLYIMVVNIAQTRQEVPPRILIVNTGNPAGEADFRLSVAEVRPFEEFQVRLWINGTPDPASEMKPVVAGTAGNVTFIDFDGGATITEGDTMVVRTVPGTAYELVLLWKGNVVDRAEWST